jgi:hypothetical protein
MFFGYANNKIYRPGAMVSATCPFCGGKAEYPVVWEKVSVGKSLWRWFDRVTGGRWFVKVYLIIGVILFMVAATCFFGASFYGWDHDEPMGSFAMSALIFVFYIIAGLFVVLWVRSDVFEHDDIFLDPSCAGFKGNIFHNRDKDD